MQKELRLTVAARLGRSPERESAVSAPDEYDGASAAAGEGWRRAALADFASGRVVWDDSSDLPIPDFDDRPMLSVSGRARGLIEAIEPAVHHFLPVVYCDRDGNVIERRYFLIVGTHPHGRHLGRVHLWHDGHPDEPPCLSPTLAEAIRASGMTGLDWDDAAVQAARCSEWGRGRIR